MVYFFIFCLYIEAFFNFYLFSLCIVSIPYRKTLELHFIYWKCYINKVIIIVIIIIVVAVFTSNLYASLDLEEEFENLNWKLVPHWHRTTFDPSTQPGKVGILWSCKVRSNKLFRNDYKPKYTSECNVAPSFLYVCIYNNCP